MTAPQHVSVLIPAAGQGERLGQGPKAALVLQGRPLLDWVVGKAAQLGGEVIVAHAPGAAVPARCRALQGGPTRQESVRRLALAATRPWVVVWDAARPFTTLALAQAVLLQAQRHGAAAAFVKAEAPMVQLDPDGMVRHHLPATSCGSFQTPLAFSRELLCAVVTQAWQGQWEASSTAALVLRAGHAIAPVTGDPHNFKLTTPQDWALAHALAQANPDLLRR